MEDKIFNELKQNMRDFSAEPDRRVWQNISAKIDNKKFSWIKTACIIGSVLLVAGIVALIFAPEKSDNQKQYQMSTAQTDETPVQNIETAVDDDNVINPQLQSTTAHNKNANTSVANKEINNITSRIATTEHILPTVNNNMSTQVKQISGTETKQKPQKQTSEDTNIGKTTEDSQHLLSKSHTKSDTEEIEGDVTDDLQLPNAFQPAGSDERINTFKPLYKDVNSYEMRIFARNGSEVFSTKDINTGWDGKIKGRLADQGTYIYYVKYEDKNGKIRTKKGTLWLSRH